jgi:DNA-binding NarL/FixJ family response regulator
MLPLRVLVADDHRLFRQGLIGLMNTRRDLVEVVGEAATGQEAVMLTGQMRPNVVLMDIQMPEGDGLQAAACIRQVYPDTAVVMLTASESEDHLYQAVRLGAAGYLLKTLDAAELFDLLSGVANGEAALTRAMAARLLKSVADHSHSARGGDETLTEREIEVLRLVAQGDSNPQIAEHLNITVNTVKVHLRNILDKLRVENRAQAAAYAVRCGLVT